MASDIADLFTLEPAVTRLRYAGLWGEAALVAFRVSGRNRDAAAGNFFGMTPGPGGLPALEPLLDNDWSTVAAAAKGF